MSEKTERGRGGETETQQALLRHTIDLNTEMIAQADRLISKSRATRVKPPEAELKDEPRPANVPPAAN